MCVGGNWSLEERRLLTALWSSQCKVCGEKSIVGEGMGVGLHSRQKARRSSGLRVARGSVPVSKRGWFAESLDYSLTGHGVSSDSLTQPPQWQ